MQDIRRCALCRLNKHYSEFPRRNNIRKVPKSYCYSCQREYSRRHYRENLEYYALKRAESQIRYRSRNRARVNTFLADRRCVDCGEADPVVLEFDHVSGTKKANVSTLVAEVISWKRISEEMAKCEIRCANCHRRRTLEELRKSRRAVAQPGRALALGARGRKFESSPPDRILTSLLKTCPRCRITKSITEFPRRRARGTPAAYCSPCLTRYNAAYYQRNAPRQKERVRQRRLLYRTKIVDYLKVHPCVDCGETDVDVLEFDHVRGSKIATVSEMFHDGFPWNQIANEIEKCEVRCSNCHRRKTARQLAWHD